MTYTAQSCREEAAINDKFGDPIMNDPDLLRAHADALEENARLLAFRNYFADKCEGLFFQFGMEVIDLYNATHGREVCRIEPERAYLHEESK